MKYNIIYADPPWQYKTKECLAKKSILNGNINSHYPTMTLDEIKGLKISELACDDALLFMWVVSPMLKEGLDVMDSWGFKYATVAFVWYKERTNPGHYTMSECELCLVGKKGRIPTPRDSRNERQFLSELRKKHSQKPNEIRDRIWRMFPSQAKVELFARQATPGWDVWGNEVASTIEL